jgi:hypothetical protein
VAETQVWLITGPTFQFCPFVPLQPWELRLKIVIAIDIEARLLPADRLP